MHAGGHEEWKEEKSLFHECGWIWSGDAGKVYAVSFWRNSTTK